MLTFANFGGKSFFTIFNKKHRIRVYQATAKYLDSLEFPAQEDEQTEIQIENADLRRLAKVG